MFIAISVSWFEQGITHHKIKASADKLELNELIYPVTRGQIKKLSKAIRGFNCAANSLALLGTIIYLALGIASLVLQTTTNMGEMVSKDSVIIAMNLAISSRTFAFLTIVTLLLSEAITMGLQHLLCKKQLHGYVNADIMDTTPIGNFVSYLTTQGLFQVRPSSRQLDMEQEHPTNIPAPSH